MHRGRSRGLHDFKHSQRDTSQSQNSNTTQSKEEKECVVGGKMFLQMGIGQYVQVDGGDDVLKFSVVSFTMPDLLGKDQEVLDAVIRQNPQLACLAQGTESFNDHGSLIGAFGTSSAPITEDTLRIFQRSFQVVEEVVISNKDSVSEGALDDFLLKNTRRKMLAANLAADAETILANPTHGGAVAYRNTKVFGEDLFRMEWIFQNGQVMTPGIPSSGYKMSVLSKMIADAQDENGDIKFINALLDFINGSYQSHAGSIFFLQVNSTATVARCGGADVSQELAQYDLLYGNHPTWASIQQAISDQIALMVSFNGSGTASTAGNIGDAGTSTSESKITCSKCGKVNDRGIPVCSCGGLITANATHQHTG